MHTENNKLNLTKSEKKIFIKAIESAYQVGREDGDFIHNYTPQLMKGKTECVKKIVTDFLSVQHK